MADNGLAALQRIIADGGRLRTDAITDDMAREARDKARELLPRADAEAHARLTWIIERITKVLDARARRRTR